VRTCVGVCVCDIECIGTTFLSGANASLTGNLDHMHMYKRHKTTPNLVLTFVATFEA